jgi:hypothetical protein
VSRVRGRDVLVKMFVRFVECDGKAGRDLVCRGFPLVMLEDGSEADVEVDTRGACIDKGIKQIKNCECAILNGDTVARKTKPMLFPLLLRTFSAMLL